MDATWLQLTLLVASCSYVRPTYLVLDESDQGGEVAGPREYVGSGGGVSGGGAACYGGARCSPLSSCRLLADLLDSSCLARDRVQNLVCGYVGSEPLVCCPRCGDDVYATRPGVLPPQSTLPTAPAPGPGSSSGLRPTSQPVASTPNAFSKGCGRRIVLGSNEGLGAQPWAVRIGFKNIRTGKIVYPCCGSIISRRTILTAAHCAVIKSEQYKLYSVVVGEYDGKGDPDCTRKFCALPRDVISISHVLVHPGFQRTIFKHDIALIVLKTPLNFSLAAQPVCIRELNDASLINRRACLVGWGKLVNQEESSSRQQVLEVPMVSLEQCANVYSASIPVTNRQLCAGGEEGRDACLGFGGAPLLVTDRSQSPVFYQVGLASFGAEKCGSRNVPSVYANVMKYAEWIRSNMVT